jgi:hypothetical protein
MVLKVNLDDFVGKSEHDCMSSSHPFLNIDYFFDFSYFLGATFSILLHDTFWLIIPFKIAPEVLEQGDLLL